MKSLAAILFALFVFASASAEKVEKMPAPKGYVNDYPGVMSTAGKAEAEAICREVHDKTKAQIFVVTITSLEGALIESFANDLYHNWKIGEKKTDRGVLLLFAIDDHKRRIEVGYGLEGILPDGKVGDIGRDMVPALKQADYDRAVLVGVRAVAAVIAADSNVTLNAASTVEAAEVASANQAVPAPTSSGDTGTFMLIGMFFLSCFGIFGLLAWLSWRRGPRRFGSNGASFGGGSSFGSSSSDSSSSFSSDSSSSSDSFSGGDGGDSGGGGASGDW